MTALAAVLREAAVGWAPPPDLSPVEWGEREVEIGEWAAKRGRWEVSVTPYMAEPINRFSLRDAYRRIVLQFGAQLGKTTGICIGLGYIIACRPRPVMVVRPKTEDAKDFAKREIAGIVGASPQLRDLVAKPRGRDADATLLNRSFKGGRLYLRSANSPAELASIAVGDLLLDEVDRFSESAGTEGDPVDLAMRRTATFRRTRKVFATSTPGNEGESRIEDALFEGDLRHFWVPCPHCGGAQVLVWAQVKWDDDPAAAWYECAHCGERIEDSLHKPAMLAAGAWRPMDHESETGECLYCREKIGADPHLPPDPECASYHLSGLYSPWTTWGDAAQEFAAARHDPERLKQWVNTVLGETWRDTFGQGVSHEPLMLRRELYQAEVPDGVVLLTAGIDLHLDRIECEVTGWGYGEESWRVAYEVLPGRVSDPFDPCWVRLEQLLGRTFRQGASGALMVTAACLDTGGGRDQETDGSITQAAYQFLQRWRGHHVYGIKGRVNDSPVKEPIWPRAPSQVRTRSGTTVTIYPVRVDVAKDLHYARLQVDEPGPGYCHLPAEADEAYCKGLVAEVKRHRTSAGRSVSFWYLPQHRRNEPLDCRVYNICALEALKVQGLVDLSTQNLTDRSGATVHSRQPPRPRARRRRVSGWRGRGRW